MAGKSTQYIFKGMQQDLSDSKQSKEYFTNAKNIRITNREGDTMMSITNEKGTKKIDISIGRPIQHILGYEVIGDYIILFAKIFNRVLTDAIIKYDTKNNSSKIIFSGNLEFSLDNPIEAFSVYESEDIQKVYWIDGKNQPRVINIAASEEAIDKWTNKSFNFIQELQLKETVTVQKQHSSGSFPSGVIQYAFCYYNKNAQESNIFYTTPIHYISYIDRGGEPNEFISNSFKITIENVDTNFDYLRIYSIHRTALDAIPNVKLVTDLRVNNDTLAYTDTGNTGEAIDPTELLYKGGEYIIPQTMVHKDGTLFFGNIELKKNTSTISENILETWRNLETIIINNSYLPIFEWLNNQKIVGTIDEISGYYPYKAYLKNGDNTTFKHGETYRLGIQFQDKTGKWSEPIHYDDSKVTTSPKFIRSTEDESKYMGVTAQLRIPSEIKQWAVDNDYLKVRPVVVFPDDNERTIIAQGILCPTLFNARERHNDTCFSQSSWFLRPFVNEDVTNSEDYTSNNATETFSNIPELGAWAEFRHYKALPSIFHRNAEIQSSMWLTYSSLGGTNTVAHPIINNADYSISAMEAASNYFRDSYFVDQSILTFHSPEIELGKVTNVNGTKIRLVGVVEFDANAGDIDIQLATAAQNPDKTTIYNQFKGLQITDNSKNTARSLISGAFFKTVYMNVDTSLERRFEYSAVYPWQAPISLVGYENEESDNAKLKSKKLSNLKFSLNTIYKTLSPPEDGNISGTPHLFTGDDIFIAPPKYAPWQDYKKYKGNVDQLIAPYVDFTNPEDNVKYFGADDITQYDFPEANEGRYRNGASDFNGKYQTFFDTYVYDENFEFQTFNANIPIKYKSTPHVVIALNYRAHDGYQYIMSDDYNLADVNTPFYSYNNLKIPGIKSLGYPFVAPVTKPYLYLAELYRDTPDNLFNGDSYSGNIWYPAGEPVSILNESGDIKDDLVVNFEYGDTFYSRFDSLKTYPYDINDVNSIVEIGSFMVETRINLDARYDRNRGQKSNLVMNPNNFNLFNDAYSQKNDFFNYRALDKDISDNTYFPSTITWTKQKFAGADVDAWTNITMASTLDLDGAKGEITSLNTFNNTIYAFQAESLSQILFNDRVQIPTSDGVPIEISNSYKVQGSRQISSIGCSNKWSIKETSYGLYFVDGITKAIYRFNNQVENLSAKLGMSSWVRQFDNLSNWSPNNDTQFTTHYDKVNSDVYFINKDICLGFSEVLGQFESFYSYEDTSYMFNVKDKFYAVNNNKLYQMFEGNYNEFFDVPQDFYIEFTHNDNEPYDKIYNTMDFRADTYDYNEESSEFELNHNKTFNSLQVYNEYQDTGEKVLEFNKNKPSNLKKKFRVWRTLIPRDKSNNRDRIRNTWSKFKLKFTNPGNTKTELHDLIINYFV